MTEQYLLEIIKQEGFHVEQEDGYYIIYDTEGNNVILEVYKDYVSIIDNDFNEYNINISNTDHIIIQLLEACNYDLK